jgi:hypothetical protein
MDTLLEEFEVDLLPTGTKVFPSRFHRSPFFWKFLTLGYIISFVILFIWFFIEDGSTKLWMFLADVGVLIFVSVYAVILNNREYELYKAKLTKDSWHEGIVVFPNGDIVIRSCEDIFFAAEVELERHTIKDVKECYLWSILGQLRFLWCSKCSNFCLYFCRQRVVANNSIEQQRPHTYLVFDIEDPVTGYVKEQYFSCANLINDPQDIVQYIKSKHQARSRGTSI